MEINGNDAGYVYEHSVEHESPNEEGGFIIPGRYYPKDSFEEDISVEHIGPRKRKFKKGSKNKPTSFDKLKSHANLFTEESFTDGVDEETFDKLFNQHLISSQETEKPIILEDDEEFIERPHHRPSFRPPRPPNHIHPYRPRRPPHSVEFLGHDPDLHEENVPVYHEDISYENIPVIR